MKQMNPRSLAYLSKVVVAATSVAIFSPIISVYASSGISTTVDQTPGNTPGQQLLLADNDDDDRDDDDRKANLPESIKVAVFRDISQRTGSQISMLRVVQTRRQIWTNGCLNLPVEGSCTQAMVKGWQVLVANQQQVWVYRTNESGTVAKLDQDSTQYVTTAMVRQQTTSRTQRETVTTQSSSQSLKGKHKGFSLAIMQPSGSLSEVVARVSLKGKRNKGYLQERFLGDYKYKVQQKGKKAKFLKGIKPGDRVVVRLYDLQNRFLGYSEFECLSEHTVVNLVLPANPTQTQIVRTVYGVDTKQDGMIDAGATSYDYFTQVSNQRVSFLNSSRAINVSQFQVQGLSTVATNSIYPTALRTGEFALLNQSLSAFSPGLPPVLKAAPGKLVQLIAVRDDSSSIYDVSQMMMNYREVGVASSIQTMFTDVSSNHWAKDFISELTALEVLQGFPDGSFRPDEQVTRAQFAAMLTQAFQKVRVRNPISFNDVSNRYWAYNAIREAYASGFLATTGSNFNPTQSLSRLEVLLALARGLNYTFSGSTETILAAYSDASSIRSDVRSAIAALTERGVIVNYPNVQSLNADKVATRAEVSALIYRALASTGEVVDISSQYAVQPVQQQTVAEEEAVAPMGSFTPRQNCNQGIGNGAEGCDPGKSSPHGGSNDEGGRTPGRR
ncbi:MAG: S-layer homology domain-containing protein [Nostoc sp. LLA-1]|nr:S-layer homology domain-containing protein [Cyanocohniella sp. LLY]